MDFENDIKIDPEALELEWLDHARRRLKYGQLLAGANRKVDKFKTQLKLVEAEFNLKARTDEQAKIEMGGKVTDSSVNSWIQQRGGYQQAITKYLNAKHEAEILDAAVRAFDQRKSALENLVRLWAGSYFAGPKEPKDISSFAREAEKDKQAKGVDRKRKGLNRTRRKK